MVQYFPGWMDTFVIKKNTFYDLRKYISRFEQIHLAIRTNTFMVRSFAKLEEEEAMYMQG